MDCWRCSGPCSGASAARVLRLLVHQPHPAARTHRALLHRAVPDHGARWVWRARWPGASSAGIATCWSRRAG
ncbi:hypothetical protein LV779_08975 [Streptomyces thinghirensis]|nr:hypothetical protein [Streptomyces thinghirensis]